MDGHLLIGLTSILVFGVGAQWVAWRFKLPAILLLLISGITAGPVLGLLNPDLLMGDLLAPFVSVSVAIILFEGGLSLRFSELKDIGSTIGNLVSIGVLVTWGITAVSAYYLFSFEWEIAILLGAILVVTGPTVIIPLLRQVRPSGQLSSILKWEGIVIDPIGAMLSVLVFEVILSTSLTAATSVAVMSIVKTILFGSIVGLMGALLMYLLLKRYLLPDYLQNPISLMLVVTVFTISNMLQHESGLWATTLMGIALANQKSARIHHITEFKENLRVLLLSALFILLAARTELNDLIANLDWQILGFIVILIFIARPISVYISTMFSDISWREKIFLSWMAPRGVVAASISSIFAINLSHNGFAQANQIVPIVFIVIIFTVAIYGLTANRVAKWLGVMKPAPRGFLIVGAHSWARQIGSILHDEGFKIILADSNWSNVNSARKKGMDTYYGNVLGENANEELNMDGVGKLMTLTPNDEVNSLAVIRFSNAFGSSEVFQLANSSQLPMKDREMPDNLSGRFLFDEEMTFEKISELLNNDWKLQLLDISHNLTQEEFDGALSDEHYPLILITDSKQAIPYTIDNMPLPQKNHKVLCLVNPDQEQTLKIVEEERSVNGS